MPHLPKAIEKKEHDEIEGSNLNYAIQLGDIFELKQQ